MCAEGRLRGRWDREGVTSRVHSKQNKSYFSTCKSIISWGGNIRIFERLYIICAFSLGRFFTLYLDEAPLLRRRRLSSASLNYPRPVAAAVGPPDAAATNPFRRCPTGRIWSCRPRLRPWRSRRRLRRTPRQTWG